MNLIKRIKNLWELSTYEPLERKLIDKEDNTTILLGRKKLATIVDMSPDIDLDD